VPRWTRSATLWLVVLSLVFTVLALKRGLVATGALTLPHLWDGEYWRVLTTTFIHAGWMHLGFNAISLYLLGGRLGIEREIGRLLYVACVLLGSGAALAASFFWSAENLPRVGISGGVLALVGLLLAEEWQHTKSLKSFLRSRNTIVILIVLVLNVAIAWWFERANPGAKVDHAGHLGGLVFGLAAGIALFAVPGGPKAGGERKTVLRRRRGLVVALLLGLLPLAYVAFPWWEPRFFRHRGMQALLEQRRIVLTEAGRDRAAFFLGRAHELDPGHPVSGAGLAIARDDPKYLDDLRTERPFQPIVESDMHGLKRIEFVLLAHLMLARERFESAPEEATRLVEAAAKIRPAPAQAWIDFATAAAGARRDDLATLARQTALDLAEGSGLSVADRSRAAQGVLPALEQRFRNLHVTKEDPIRLCLDTAKVLAALAPRIAEDSGLPDNKAEAIEQWIVRMLERMRVAHTGAQAPARIIGSLRRQVARLYNNLAVDSRVEAREPQYVFQSARWLLMAAQVEGSVARDASAIAKRALDALQDAEEYGDTATAAAVTAWLARHRADLGAADAGD